MRRRHPPAALLPLPGAHHEHADASRYQHYIDGANVEPASGEYLPTDNPYTGKTWG